MGQANQSRQNPTPLTRPENPWATDSAAIASALDVDVEQGLGEDAVTRRHKQFGHNQIREFRPPPVWKIFLDQIDDLVIIFLIVTAVVALVLGYTIEGIAVGFVVLVTAAVGMFMELRARSSMEALREMSQVTATVLRDGQPQQVPAAQLVPGDIALLDEGDVVSADMRIFKASRLQVAEAALTGESMPVTKDAEVIDAQALLADRENMLFSGTSVTRGTGRAIVVATGMDTELGEVSALVDEQENLDTPLEKRLNRLASRLIWVTLGLSALIFPAGLIAGQSLELVATTAIALAIATVPEGLPVVATLTLARGMMRMARHNALLRRLASVETLGATTVICTDKTGTLTENTMTVARLAIADDQGQPGATPAPDDLADGPEAPMKRLIDLGVLCNNAHADDDQVVGDPMEVALLQLGQRFGSPRDDLLDKTPQIRQVAFDSETKMMATFHEAPDDGDHACVIAVKGAPEEVIKRCETVLATGQSIALSDAMRQQWLEANQQLSTQGLRLLAVAQGHSHDHDADPYDALSLVGLVAFYDPPRADVAQALKQCHRAGIRVVMVTGDQPATAQYIAKQIGLVADTHGDAAANGDSARDDDSHKPTDLPPALTGDALVAPDDASEEERKKLLATPIFARVSPRQKLNLIDLHQGDGQVVAMTGDGVNDAPALTHADIGIAMGIRGTEVARDASDLILQDDRFATIVHGIEEGRLIFANIRRFVIFLLSINFASILAIAAASLVGAPIPVTPLQILYLNMLTDVFPALALVTTGGSAALMDRPPRSPEEPVLTRSNWLSIGGYGALLAIAVLASLATALNVLNLAPAAAITVSFLTLGFGKAFHALNMRGDASTNPVLKNKMVWAAIGLCSLLLAAAAYLPWLSDLLEATGPGAVGWLVILGFALLPLGVIQIIQVVRRRRRSTP